MSNEVCPHERRLETLERRYEMLLDNIRKMEDKFDTKLDLILLQINKVSILEEKHTYQSAALERAFNRIQLLDDAMDKLSSFKDHTMGMAKMAYIIWGAMGVSITAMLVKIYG